MRKRRLALFPAALLAACQPGIADPGAPLEHDEALTCSTQFQDTWIPVQQPTTRSTATSGAPITIFLNRGGQTLEANYDDAPHGQSSVVASTGMSTATITPYPGSDGDWQNLVACVKDEFARFNVTVTDQRPTTSDWMMAMFGGDASALGFPPNVGGVAPLDPIGCQNIPDAIVFIFSGAVGADPQLNCEIAAQEISHAFSLDHEYLASDPMTYLQYAGHKTFQDQDAQCGEYQPRQCICNRPSQNSVQTLLQHVGAAAGATMNPPPDTTPPTVAVASPGDGTSVASGSVDVVIDASDDTAVAGVTLFWQDTGAAITSRCGDGVVPCVASSGQYRFTVPASHAGAALVHAQADDAAGNHATSSTVHLTVGGGSTGGGTTGPMSNMSVMFSVDDSTFDATRVVTARASVHDGGQGANATLVWTDAGNTTTRLPMCPTAPGEFTLPLRLAFATGMRVAHVEASDGMGHTVSSAPVRFVVH